MSLGSTKRCMPRHAVIQPLDESVRLIPLTKGQDALVDAFLYEWLSQWNWCAQYVAKRGCYYAARREGDALIFMHCQIVNTGQDVDHENRNTLDNRGTNLRSASRSCNIANRPRQCNNKSGFKGVFFNSQKQKWHAKIQVNGRSIHAGFHSSPIEAARSYDSVAIEKFGEFAYTNFPRSDYRSEVA
jgi:hypothetical protein